MLWWEEKMESDGQNQVTVTFKEARRKSPLFKMQPPPHAHPGRSQESRYALAPTLGVLKPVF